MKLQLWRNATLLLNAKSGSILIDPMLGEKGTLGKFPWTEDTRQNPLLDLPFSRAELELRLNSASAVFVSHLHPDHWDEAAIELINKTTPIIAPPSIAGTVASFGFQDVRTLHNSMDLDDMKLHITEGRHGKGEIEEKMGEINGLVVQTENNTVYVVGDSVWCQEVHEVIQTFQPDHIVIAAGAATFSIGDPVTMTAEDIKETANSASNAKIWITHLEAISPCVEGRTFLKGFLKKNKLEDQCYILDDGEEVILK